MKQLIYRNPLSVLWQMQMHGVKFVPIPVIAENDKGEFEVGYIRVINGRYGVILSPAEKPGYMMDSMPFVADTFNGFRVHPDSLPLYEPQEGDVYEWGKPGYNSETNMINWRENEGKIITRNGIPFHWPCEIREESDA